MLSDSLSDAYDKIIESITHYSTDPFEVCYPLAQEDNLKKALLGLLLAINSYDRFEPDDEKHDACCIKRFKRQVADDFRDALGGGVCDKKKRCITCNLVAPSKKMKRIPS
jgi:hypothetical protein